MPTPPTRAPDAPWLWFAAVIGVVVLAYSNAVTSALVGDAQPLIVTDPRVQSTDPELLRLIFTRDYWWARSASELYRPLTTLSFWFNYTVLGNATSGVGYHILNVAVHIANAGLVMTLARRLTGRTTVAALAAAVFALHPIATEAVTNVAGRADLLATLAVLATAWSHLRWRDTRKSRWLACAATTAFLGVFAKESAIVFVPFLVLCDLLFPDSGGRRRTLLAYAAYLPAVAGFVVTRLVMSSTIAAVPLHFVDNPLVDAPALTATLTALHVTGRYVSLLLFPLTLSADYSYAQIPLVGDERWLDGFVVLALVAAAVMIWVAWRMRTRAPAVSWGLLFLLIAPVVTSNLAIRIGTIMAERFLYLPSVGFSVAVAAFIHGIAERLGPRRATAAIVVALLGPLATRTYVRNDDWRSETAIWASVVESAPRSFKGYLGLANALAKHDPDGRHVDSALVLAERSLAILDTPPLPVSRQTTAPMLTLGVLHRTKALQQRAAGDTGSAVAHLLRSREVLFRAVEVDHWFSESTRETWNRRRRGAGQLPAVGNPTVHVELAHTCILLGEADEAWTAATHAQRLRPGDVTAWLLAGTAARLAGRFDDAAVAFTAAILLEPATAQAWQSLAAVYAESGQPSPIRDGGRGATLDQSDPDASRLLVAGARLLVQRFDSAGRSGEARQFAEDAARALGVPRDSLGAFRHP